MQHRRLGSTPATPGAANLWITLYRLLKLHATQYQTAGLYYQSPTNSLFKPALRPGQVLVLKLCSGTQTDYYPLFAIIFVFAFRCWVCSTLGFLNSSFIPISFFHLFHCMWASHQFCLRAVRGQRQLVGP